MKLIPLAALLLLFVHLTDTGDDMTPRVFIVEKPKQVRIDGLELYGEIVCIFGDEAPRISVLKCDVFMRDVASRLRSMEFNPAADRFCVIPPVLTSALTLATLAKYCGSHSLRLVVFNANTARYEERCIDLETICTPA